MRKALAFIAAGLVGIVAACGSETPAAPVAQQPIAQGVDLALPGDKLPESSALPSLEPREDFNPLLVKNIDVVDPQRREYIESLRAGWVADATDEWVFEECRRLGKLKAAGQLDEYQSGLDALNTTLRANGSPFTVSDIGDSTITLTDETERLSLIVPLPATPARGARAPKDSPYPRGYMPPYGK